ncbi:MAG: UvrD-helicase domain-containing protein [Candidatus Sabulitectum sp.]|nr:UvrD-helicase domain-containing protein [Candidatus Sabulitectum sp.]
MISDKSVREAIRNEKDRSVVVEASAGTGKTTLLTDRVKTLVENGIPLEKLALVTFTEAAASELRVRIRKILSPEDRRAMDQAWITTIHGFASRILREYFHLCGGAPEFSTEAGHFSRSELEIHWDLFLAGADPAVLRDSAESLKTTGSAKLLEVAGEIENYRWFTDSYPLGNTEDELKKTSSFWKQRIESLIPLCTCQSDKLLERIRNSISSLHDGIPEKINLRGGSAGNWGNRESLAEAKAVLKEYNDTGVKLISAYTAVIPLLPAIDKLVIPFGNRMRAIWDSDPTRLSFDDLLYRAWLAVSRSQELRKELNDRFNHIFIDEFQDTSLVQVRLFSILLEQSGLQKKLTVMGDPKQSIFGWRSADIETYKDTLRRLENDNALFKTILVNFRSGISIIDFVNSFGNALFTAVPPDEKPFSCDYSPIEARPDAGKGDGVTVYRLPDLPAAEMACVQAHKIADLIQNPASTAILFRTGTHLDALILELDRRDIPYRVEARRDFHKRKEVEDTANLIRAILCPSDKYALAKTFRSIFFGISDRDITLWRLNRPPDSIKAAEELLLNLRQVSHTLSPGPFMETLFRNTCLLLAVEESGYQVARRLGNLKFILEAAHRTSDYALLLETLTGKAPMSAEEPSAPPESHTGVVTLTTIHRAKGLAWKHVILANPGNSFNNTTPAVLANSRNLTAGIKIVNGLTAHYQRLSEREKTRSRAEYRRLLYVAVTRPRQKLDIFIPEKAREGSPAGIMSNALTAATGLYKDETIPSDESPGRILPDNRKLVRHEKPDDFILLYPESLPVIHPDRERQMRLGTEVHRILEFIDFEKPDLWLSSNKEQLYNSLEFPDEAVELALKFFEIFDLEGAEVAGREYPLLVDGKQYYIDLLIRRKGILEVIDYKTDRDDPEKKTEEYRDKQLLYRNTLKKLTGKEVKAKLVFLRHGVIIDIQQKPEGQPRASAL